MSVTYKVYDFPNFKISKQLFHVPGAAADGGYTSGGARIMSPEPGGYGVLEIQPALNYDFTDPIASWLMSKTNGQLFKLRLAPTPQIAIFPSIPWGEEGIYPDAPWSNDQNWSGDATTLFVAVALEGSNVVQVNMIEAGLSVRPGHLIGHENTTYMIDEIEYDDGIATIVVSPPLRRSIAVDDVANFRPYFVGTISNGSEFKTTYDANMVGHIQLGKIILQEVILP